MLRNALRQPENLLNLGIEDKFFAECVNFAGVLDADDGKPVLILLIAYQADIAGWRYKRRQQLVIFCRNFFQAIVLYECKMAISEL